MFQRIAILLEMIKFAHSIFALPFAVIAMLLAGRDLPGRLAAAGAGGPDPGVHGGGPQRGDDLQPHRRCRHRRPQSADVETGTAGRPAQQGVRLGLPAGDGGARSSRAARGSGGSTGTPGRSCWRCPCWRCCAATATPSASPAWRTCGWESRRDWPRWLRGSRSRRTRWVWPAFVLGAAVLLWMVGFDIIYALQDVEVDRREGLFSLPSRLGPARALLVSRVCHAAGRGAAGLAGRAGRAWA